MNILALEASTTSAKAMLFQTDSQKYTVKTKPYDIMSDDPSMHDADVVYAEMMAVGRELACGKRVDLITLCATWHGLLLCDNNMTPVSPVYLWSYTGARNLCDDLRRDENFATRFYEKTGCLLHGSYPIFKFQFLKQNNAHLGGCFVTCQGGYHNYKLTGELATTECMASGTGFYNIRNRDYDEELLQYVGVTRENLPRIVGSTKTFPLCEEAAALLGVDAHIPVLLSNSDGGLNQIGAGGSKDNIMTLSVGTSGAIRISTNKPVLSKHPSTWCYRFPKGYLIGAATSGACNCTEYVKNQIGNAQMTYEELEKDALKLQELPIFLPFLYGERAPGWKEERGRGFYGIKPKHNTCDLYMSAQLGVLFNLYQCYNILVKENGLPDRVKLSGGILHSKRWTQMCADLFQVDLEVDETEQSSLLGGAVLGMEALGILRDTSAYEKECSYVVHPNTDKADAYRREYERYLTYYKGEEIMKYDIAVYGLGVMGASLAKNMIRHGYRVIVYNYTKDLRDAFSCPGFENSYLVADSEEEMIAGLREPAAIFIMVTAGAAVDSVIDSLKGKLKEDSILMDGGNSFYRDTIRRYEMLRKDNIHFLGIGVSGGEKGALYGPSMMVGGSLETYSHVKEILTTIAAGVDEVPCCSLIGQDGAGHYVKMVHNGIEYGILQLIAETYYLLKNVCRFNREEILKLFTKWQNGPLNSYLIDITVSVLAKNDTDGTPLVEKILDVARAKGTGKWTAIESIERDVYAPTIYEALMARSFSTAKSLRQEGSRKLSAYSVQLQIDNPDKTLSDALLLGMIACYSQGLNLIAKASEEFGWEIDFAGLIDTWRDGCIIRSALLSQIREAVSSENREELLLCDTFSYVADLEPSLRDVVCKATGAAVAVPAYSSVMHYYDYHRTEKMPVYLIQALRDCFGAHTYERIDEEGIFHTNWQED